MTKHMLRLTQGRLTAKLLLLNVMAAKWAPAEKIEIHSWSSEIQDILLKMPSFENGPFKGKHSNLCRVWESGIFLETRPFIKFV
jgi:hypothetical protein